MEIRNALILLTKISSVFPVTRKSGINLEKRVAKIKSDEREDLKVLATGVAAALASRKPSWVTDEEFGMGYLELKLATAPAPASKSSAVNSVAIPNGNGPSVSQGEPSLGRTMVPGRVADGKLDRPDSSMPKPDLAQVKQKGSHSIDGLDVQSMPSAALQSDIPSQKHVDDSLCTEESTIKAASKMSGEQEGRATGKRATPDGSFSKQQKHDIAKDDKSGKVVGRASGAASGGDVYPSESRASGNVNVSTTVSGNGSTFSTVLKNSTNSAFI